MKSAKTTKGSRRRPPRERAVWITRHGNRMDFVDARWLETAERPHDPPLSPDGVVQARELGLRLKGEGIRHVFASPFLRAVETAHCAAQALELPIKLEPGAAEWLKESWFPKGMPDFLPAAVLAGMFPRVDARYVSPLELSWPETQEQMAGRARATIRRIVRRFRGDILVVGHGASMVEMARGLAPEAAEIHCGLCALVKLVQPDGSWALELRGDTSHLSRSEEELRLH